MKKDESIHELKVRIHELEAIRDSKETLDEWLIIQDMINILELKVKAREDRQNTKLKKSTVSTANSCRASYRFQ